MNGLQHGESRQFGLLPLDGAKVGVLKGGIFCLLCSTSSFQAEKSKEDGNTIHVT